MCSNHLTKLIVALLHPLVLVKKLLRRLLLLLLFLIRLVSSILGILASVALAATPWRCGSWFLARSLSDKRKYRRLLKDIN